MPLWLIAILDLLKWAAEKFAVPWVKKEIDQHESEKKSDSADKLQNAQTEKEIKDAAKDYLTRP